MPHNGKQNTGSTAMLWLHTNNLVSFLCEATSMLQILLVLEGLLPQTAGAFQTPNGVLATHFDVRYAPSKMTTTSSFFCLITLSLRYER